MRTRSLPLTIFSLAVLLTINTRLSTTLAEGTSLDHHSASEHDAKKNEPSRDGDKDDNRRDCKVPPATATNFWALDGNAGTSPTNGNFIGTTDDQPLELKVNGLRAMRFENNGVSSYELSFGFLSPNGSPNVIGGSPVNFVSPGVVGAVIAGGGTTNYAGDSDSNSIFADFGVIGGGVEDQILPGAVSSVIAGGNFNIVQSNAVASAILGGVQNQILPGACFSAIGGGEYNLIGTNAVDSAIGGGYFNYILDGARESTIGGGSGNQIRMPDQIPTTSAPPVAWFSRAGLSGPTKRFHGRCAKLRISPVDVRHRVLEKVRKPADDRVELRREGRGEGFPFVVYLAVQSAMRKIESWDAARPPVGPAFFACQWAKIVISWGASWTVLSPRFLTLGSGQQSRFFQPVKPTYQMKYESSHLSIGHRRRVRGSGLH